MRVTQNSIVEQYQFNLQRLQEQITRTNLHLSSGKAFLSPSEAPLRAVDVKHVETRINQNRRFKTNIEKAITELDIYEFALENFSTNLRKARSIVETAVDPVNYDKPTVLGEQIRRILDDLLEIANYQHNGRFLFAGTRTTEDSITPTPPETTKLPFELLQDPAAVSADNPEGLRIAFKGNFQSRSVLISANIQERINTLANDAFGTNGTKVFEILVEIYNVLTYKRDGTARGERDFLDTTDARKLQALADQLSDHLDQLHNEIGRVGGVRIRLETQLKQITYENTRLNELKSIRGDADVAQEAINLTRFQTSLNYTLRVGARLFQTTLFDFL